MKADFFEMVLDSGVFDQEGYANIQLDLEDGFEDFDFEMSSVDFSDSVEFSFSS